MTLRPILLCLVPSLPFSHPCGDPTSVICAISQLRHCNLVLHVIAPAPLTLFFVS